MKQLIFIVILAFILPNCIAQKEVSLLKDGIILPRLTQTQRNGLSAEEGQIIYNLNTEKINVYNGTGWEDDTVPSLWSKNGSRIYYNAGRIGIRVPAPKTIFHIAEGERAY